MGSHEVSDYVISDLKECGVEQQFCQTDRIYGVTKGRYCDFYVKEIDLSGNLVELSNLAFSESSNHNSLDDGEFTTIQQTIKDRLKELEENDQLSKIDIICEGDKNCRKNIHDYIRRIHSNFISSTDNSDTKMIHVEKVDPGEVEKIKKSERWRPNVPEYTHFTLYKENMSTNEAISFLCNRLNVNTKLFTFSGTKDKRGITLQRVSAYKVHPQTLIDTMKQYYETNSRNSCKIILGDFSRQKHQLKLGDLKGNYFEVVIRDISLKEASSADVLVCERITGILDPIISNIRVKGFPNFFGKQRFGVGSTSTHLIGLSIIRSEWELVVDYILSYRPKMSKSLRNAIDEWKSSREAGKAWTLLKYHERHLPESCVLKKIKLQNGRIDSSVLSFVSYSTQLLYLHAFQSFVWNKILSRRIREFGEKMLLGDLLRDNEENDIIIATSAHLDDEAWFSKVVLPLPGHDIIYPDNIVKTWYFEIYEELKIDQSMFLHKVKKYSLPGSYRYITSVPKDLSYSVMKCQDEVSLVKTEKDLLDIPLMKENGTIADPTGESKLCIKLSFTLGSCSYATTLINQIVTEKYENVKQMQPDKS